MMRFKDLNLRLRHAVLLTGLGLLAVSGALGAYPDLRQTFPIECIFSPFNTPDLQAPWHLTSQAYTAPVLFAGASCNDHLLPAMNALLNLAFTVQQQCALNFSTPGQHQMAGSTLPRSQLVEPGNC